LVVAASEVDVGVRTLKIDVIGDQVDAQLDWGAGKTLEQKSLAYELLLPESPIAAELGQLTGSLVAGNSSGVAELLLVLGIDFVLLDGEDQESISSARVAIDSMTMLQAAGETPYGYLWQVLGATADTPTSARRSDSKNLELGILAAFLLLAIPTPASIRGTRRARSEK
jgi:hypothetical protein